MEKAYFLRKIELFGLQINKIIYDFDVKKTNLPTRFINIIIHHTGKQKTIDDVIDSHIKKNRYSSIGYHFMISKTGKIYQTRELKFAGAHTFEYNKNSIGIALFGNFDNEIPNKKQIESLNNLTKSLKKNFPIKRILGHNEAIFKSIKNKFWRLNIDNIDLLDINSRLSFDIFRKEVIEKVLESDASPISVNLVKKFTSCPGFHLYQKIIKLRENFQ